MDNIKSINPNLILGYESPKCLELIELLKKNILKKANIPPVKVIFENGYYKLYSANYILTKKGKSIESGGHHRSIAYLQLGLKIPVIIDDIQKSYNTPLFMRSIGNFPINTIPVISDKVFLEKRLEIFHY